MWDLSHGVAGGDAIMGVNPMTSVGFALRPAGRPTSTLRLSLLRFARRLTLGEETADLLHHFAGGLAADSEGHVVAIQLRLMVTQKEDSEADDVTKRDR